MTFVSVSSVDGDEIVPILLCADPAIVREVADLIYKRVEQHQIAAVAMLKNNEYERLA